ncbi:hypothetical protein [Arthrobacter sp. CJ23]|uniref:hypothetical protein n=1 Tax=Arthrobacter sp. CJ23 TaxID=2972479 RepID=UPI00215D0542|nr:hypothetical protein [Arthrobacter sp. CJ23]UVJ38046.1 hypothetical protein NVV90_12320 [Arthrobacter sp. CJ23]
MNERGVFNTDKLIAQAAAFLGISIEEAGNCRRDLPELHALYVWKPGRGGGSLIIGSDGTYLFANSSVSLDQHLAAFESGKRTQQST